jgi:hypothetical protein
MFSLGKWVRTRIPGDSELSAVHPVGAVKDVTLAAPGQPLRKAGLVAAAIANR